MSAKKARLKLRDPFPVVMDSPAMQQLFGTASIQSKERRIQPIVIRQGNRLELASFFRRLARQINRTGSVCICSDPKIDPLKFEEGEDTSFLFLQGASLHAGAQRTILRHLLHVPLVAVAIEPEDVTRLADLWIPRLAEECAPLLTWPAWRERTKDQPKLCEVIRQSYALPDKRPAPKFSPEALRLLLATDFSDLRAVQDTIKGAIQAYIAGRMTGPITAELLSSRRSLKRQSRPEPTALKVVSG